MASAMLTEEVNDLVSCPVCLSEYDDVVESRKPKFLPCSHTLCVQCLRSIKNCSSLACPICRKASSHVGDVSSLPNNSYAICILKLTKDKKPPADKSTSTMKLVYCLTCQTMSRSECSLYHTTVDVTPRVLTNRGTLKSLHEDLASLKDPLCSKVAKAILEKKDIQSYLEEVLRALKAAETEVGRLKEENDVMVAELSSLMETGLLADADSMGDGSDDFKADLRPLLKDCLPEDTLNTVKDKMRRSFQDRAKDIERKVDSCFAHKSSQLVSHQVKRRLSVQATDPKGAREEVDLSVNWEAGIKSGLMANSKEQLLISHLLHSFLERRAGLPVKPLAPQDPPIGIRAGPSIRVIAPAVPLPTKRKFILAATHRGVDMGQVEFEPSEVHNTAFTSILLAEFQRRRDSPPQTLWNTVDMAIPGSFVTLPLVLDDVLKSKIRFDGDIPRSPGDVGIYNTNTTMGNRPLWSLFFTLNEFGGPYTTEKHWRTMESAALLGRVTKGFDTVNLLSRLTKIQREFCKFTLESI